MIINKSNQKVNLIVALGNPGTKYQNTRHNAGFIFLEYLLKLLINSESSLSVESKEFDLYTRYSIPEIKLIAIKPTTFMNNSGEAVKKVIKKEFGNINPQEILVIHDDLDIELGKYKIDIEKSPKGHNGIISIENTLGTKQFWRLRIGIENRNKVERLQFLGMDYVLQKFTDSEMQNLDEISAKIIDKEFNFS